MSERAELVYAGAAMHDGAVVHAYYRVEPDGSLEDRAQVFPEPLGDFPPGAVCSYVVSANGAQVVRSGSRFVRVHGDPKLIVEWRSRHDAIMASEQAWATKDLPSAFKVLEPMRDAYARLGEEQQGVLIAQVVRFIVSVKPKSSV